MDRNKAKSIAWRTGNLSYLLKKQPVMKVAHEEFRDDRAKQGKGRIWYWNVARQTGKSYSLCVLALEQCLSVPGSQVKYASVDGKQTRAIVFPQMERLLADCPEDMLPTFRQLDGQYYFPHNGSRITIAGTDKDNIKKLRGQTCHLAIVDEGAFMANLEQVLLSVLLPQTTTTRGRVIVGSTPAESSGHYSTQLAMSCKSRGSYAKFDIWDNQLLSEEEKYAIIAEYGGQESTRFRREYLCEFVTDTANAVVPEFTEAAEKETTVDSIQRPDFYDAYTCLDGGYKDATGCLFAFVDYKTAKLVVEAEWLQKGALGSDMAQAVSGIENDLWKDQVQRIAELPGYRGAARQNLVPFKRIMDVDPGLTAEFLRNHGMVWNPVEKTKIDGHTFKQAAVNQLNDFIKQRRLVIKSSCKALIRQLHNGVWDNNRKTYKRDSIDSHYELIDCLVYMLRHVDFTHNPWPTPIPDVNNTYVNLEQVRGMSDTEQVLMDAFALKGFE